IISRRHWRYDDVAHFAAPGERDIRRVENWSPERNRERLILRDAFQDFLLADVGIIRARSRVSILKAFRRTRCPERRLGLILKQLRTVDILQGRPLGKARLRQE